MRRIFPALIAVMLLTSCATMHSGGSGMERNHDNDHTQNSDRIHVMGDHFHIDIHIKSAEPVLATVTITEAETGNPAQNITGVLSVRETDISSKLKADLPEEGQYTTAIHLPAAENDELPMLLTIKDEEGVQSTFDFALAPDRNAVNQQDSNRRPSFLKTKILVGSAIGVAKLLWLLGVF